MSSHDQAHPHGDLVNVDVHHEESDINLRALLWFVVMLTATVLAVDVVCYGMFKLMNRYEASNEPYVTPLAVPIGQDPAQSPRQTPARTDPAAAAAADDAVDRPAEAARAGARVPEHLRLGGRAPGHRAHSDREGE